MIEMMPQLQANALERLDLHLDIPHEIPELKTLLNETVLVGGKRFRPGLCFLMGGILGVEPQEIAPYARVSELMHAATLAHDDVIDEAAVRRNRPTLNKISTNQKAVLTGDLLLARVVFEIANLGNVEILRDGAQVLEDLVRGEWLQIDRRMVSDVTRARLEQAAQKKTASLIAWCCTMPARLSLPTGELLERCRNFGNLVGLSFQMADDIVDFERGGEKPYANDITEGLVNFVVLEMMDRSPSLKDRVQPLLGSSPGEWPWTEGELDTAKEGVRVRVRALLERAREELRVINRLSRARADQKDLVHQALDEILILMAERVR